MMHNEWRIQKIKQKNMYKSHCCAFQPVHRDPWISWEVAFLPDHWSRYGSSIQYKIAKLWSVQLFCIADPKGSNCALGKGAVKGARKSWRFGRVIACSPWSGRLESVSIRSWKGEDDQKTSVINPRAYPEIMYPVLFYCWPTDFDGWPTIKQYRIYVSCLLGYNHDNSGSDWISLYISRRLNCLLERGYK